MNDKCADGAGVIIEKIAAKLHVSREDLVTQTYEHPQLYPVAGKCGVFAETDITGLQKHGVPNNDLIASLFHASVLQNLSILTRGNTLMPTVFLLGRPTYFPGLQTAWRKGLFRFLETQEYPSAGYSQPRDAGECPSHCGVFRRDGAIEFGASEPECGLQYYGIRALEIFIRENDRCPDLIGSRRGLFADAAELIQIRAKYAGNASAAPTPASHPSDAFYWAGWRIDVHDGRRDQPNNRICDEQPQKCDAEYRSICES